MVNPPLHFPAAEGALKRKPRIGAKAKSVANVMSEGRIKGGASFALYVSLRLSPVTPEFKKGISLSDRLHLSYCRARDMLSCTHI